MASVNYKRMKDRFNSSVSSQGVVGFDFTILMTLLPTLIQLFQSCKKQPPPNPQPSPTPAEQKAYEMNWHATTSYKGGKEHYANSAINQTAREIRRKNKKDGTKISKDESRTLAISALDEARLNDVKTLAEAIEQNGG